MTRAGVLRALACGVMLMCPISTAAQETLTIEKLIEQGWEVAGYIAAFENRTLILFKHKDEKYLVQCSVLIDVMRRPRVITYCYELR